MTDQPRTCKKCGVPEVRGTTSRGRPTLSLDPTTLLCLRCTIDAAKAPKATSGPIADRTGEFFDARAAASRNDE